MEQQIRKRLLITGASGFIGGYLVEEALKQGFEVWAAVRTHSSRSRLTDPRIRFVEVDYSSSDAIRNLANRLAPPGEPAWHYVIHNAGVTKTAKRSVFYEVNALQTHCLVEGLSTAECRPERFVLMSSLGTYGPPIVSGHPTKESDRQQPNTDYGKSKLLGERYVLQGGIPYSIMHLTGVYGPGDRDYLMAIQAINKGWDLTAGLSKQILTFVYASDVAEATLFLLTNPRAEGKRYMLTDGGVYTDAEFGRLVQSLLGKSRVFHLGIPLPFVFLACFVGECVGRLCGKITPLNLDKYRIFRQRSWLCDDTPIRQLGFTPKVGLTEGLRRTIEEARSQGLL